MQRTTWRIARAGIAVAALVAAASWAAERARFGASDQDAVARIERDLDQRFRESADTLSRIAAQVVAERIAIGSTPRGQFLAVPLFDAVDRALPPSEADRTGITVYNPLDEPVAWAGRTSELTKQRIDRPAPLFYAPDPLGPRLIRIEPVVDLSRPAPARLGTVVVERRLGAARGTPGVADTFILSDALVPVSLRVRIGDVSPGGSYTIVIASPFGGSLVDAEVSPDDLARARARWKDRTWAGVLSILGISLLLCAVPLLEERRRTRDTRVFVAATSGVVGAILIGRILFWFAASPILGRRPMTSPLDLIVTALAFTAIVWVAVDSIERWRLAGPRPRLLLGTAEVVAWVALAYVAAGVAVTAIVWVYERVLQGVASRTTLDLLQFSLHPLTGPRIALASSLVLLHAGVIWSAAGVTRLPTVWRTRRALTPQVEVTAWLAGVALAVGLLHGRDPGLPIPPLLAAIAAAGAGSIAISTIWRRTRRATQAARLWTLFLALLVPALAMYPSLLAFTIAAKERLVALDYGRLVAHQRADLQDALYTALDEIDAQPALAGLVSDPQEATVATPYQALAVWRETDLRNYRLTSAIELYGASGRLVSRFTLIPEYAAISRESAGCKPPRPDGKWVWDVVDEVLPFGSSQRPVLRASRGICVRGRPVGAIVVSMMLDFGTLPFIEPQSPFLESLQPEGQAPAEGAFGRDVEYVVYGWSRAPLYASGTSVWLLPDGVFQQMVRSRASFWASIPREGADYRVFFMNDPGGIYALGYPVIRLFGHLVNLGELVFLVGVLYLALLAGAALAHAMTSRTPASGRALLREIRASFYRKLFLAFVLATVVPLIILAIVIRTYFATQLRAGTAESAAKTAMVAQRLIEDLTLRQQRGARTLAALDDPIMALVRGAINEDVNLFEGAQLQATSERDLFASGLMPVRTPADVYRRIVLDQLPTYVRQEDGYLLAAAPVRAGGREGVVTVPVTLRREESERQIDDLDRQVLSAAVLFSLVGAAVGYGMAERIADPISRLTRATRRIARGNLDARVAAAASDELGRLINDFNGMADELKRQRTELERTQRLEAWADMARQVAHDIKNPLTPIQLSAEHARRVNIDHGRPLSPVLDECISAILSQVRLLRQIATEFSSFASTATAHPAPTSLSDLLDEVVGPYRSGLAGRIAIDVRVPDHLPAIDVDRNLLARAFTNVIENALHAMPGSGRLSIVVSCPSALAPPGSSPRSGEAPPAPQHVVIEIADTGIGMDPESMTRLFEPYFSTKAAGTGLGLTIAKRNLELNGGTIQVRSQKGVGTTVTMTLPIAGILSAVRAAENTAR
jgi:signal transduction histidine kinase